MLVSGNYFSEFLVSWIAHSDAESLVQVHAPQSSLHHRGEAKVLYSTG